jgi:hypothetical protein
MSIPLRPYITYTRINSRNVYLYSFNAFNTYTNFSYVDIRSRLYSRGTSDRFNRLLIPSSSSLSALGSIEISVRSISLLSDA